MPGRAKAGTGTGSQDKTTSAVTGGNERTKEMTRQEHAESTMRWTWYKRGIAEDLQQTVLAAVREAMPTKRETIRERKALGYSIMAKLQAQQCQDAALDAGKLCEVTK